MFPERRFTKEYQTHCLGYVRTTCQPNQSRERSRGGQRPCQPYNPSSTSEVYDKIAAVHNSSVGHWGHAKCKLRLNDPSVSDRMISTFIWQCPCCQVMSRLKIQIKTHAFTCASYLPFELINLDHRVQVTIYHHHHHHHLRRILESYGILSEWMKLFTKR